MSPTPEQKFAANMKTERERLGWSQADLANQVSILGFSWYPATVYRVEKGERRIPLNEALAIAAILNRPLSVMAGIDEYRLVDQPTISHAAEAERWIGEAQWVHGTGYVSESKAPALIAIAHALLAGRAGILRDPRVKR